MSMVTGISKNHQQVQPRSILMANIVIPPSTVLVAVDNNVVTPILVMKQRPLEQSQCLVGIRDSFISGEIRVGDIKQTVGVA